MPMLDIAGHLAFALILLSFLVRDIVWLRIPARLRHAFATRGEIDGEV